MASGTANADSHSNQTTLISHQASHRSTVVAIAVAARVHVGRIHEQAVHEVAIADGRGPPEAVATLTDHRARTTVEVARQRRR